MKQPNFSCKLLLIVFLATAVVAQPYLSFQDYVVGFHKVYSDHDEYVFREGIYNARVATFPSITRFTPGINKLTDRTEEEIKSLSNLKQLPEEQRKSSAQKLETKLGVPASLDWRDHNILTSVKDQGECGVCWSFTSVGLTESFMARERGQTSSIDLSEQFLAECTTGNSCNGGFIEDGLDRISSKCPQENQYPYIAPTLYGGSICSASGVSTNTKRVSYYSLSDSQMISLLQLGPVAVGVASTGWSSYSSGTITCSSSDPVDHAVILVGYTPDAYIVRNSWGTTWGDAGYAYLSRTTGSNCQVLGEAHYLISGSKFEAYRLFSAIFLLALAILY